MSDIWFHLSTSVVTVSISFYKYFYYKKLESQIFYTIIKIKTIEIKLSIETIYIITGRVNYIQLYFFIYYVYNILHL